MTQITGDWLTDPATGRVMEMLNAAGYAAHFVGGCVRNALLDVAVQDVDIATDALPDQVIALAKAAGLKPIPTGIDHGTITVISSGTPYEITTYRKDIETDGRRAVISFADHMADDAHRRDFTMNALYADASGEICDPLGGLPDLEARRVRFIDDAGARIQEDYLRILRFFRFHAWYGDPVGGMDPDALAAIAENLDGLATLSRERVGSEIKKLLAAENPAPSVAAMAQAGVLARVLPGSDHRFLAPLIHVEGGEDPDSIRRLAVLGGEDPTDILRLSKNESRRWRVLHEQMAAPNPVAENGYRHGSRAAIDIELLRCAMFEQLPTASFRDDAAHGAAQKFPLRAADLIAEVQGPELGARLKDLETAWIKSDFKLSKEQLLS